MLSQKIYAIGIHNYRTFRLPEDCFQGRKGTGGLSQSGTYEHRVHAGKLFFNLCRRVRAEGTIPDGGFRSILILTMGLRLMVTGIKMLP